jgi:dTDP-4-amino-4,6-dideoxygalactose transaminase
MSIDIPLVDLKAQYASIQPEIDAAIQAVIDQAAFAGGPFVEAFEANFAAFCGTRYAIGTSSGTSALHLALLAVEVGPGDEVITVPNTFVATVEAIVAVGARPVLVDVEERYHTLDPGALEAAITPQTKAIIPVHLYGQPVDMDPLAEVARANDLRVIEDAAQAHGARYKGRTVGSLGDVGCFSFYPAKNLGAYGEAGMLVTDDPDVAERARLLRNHGLKEKHHHVLQGFNFRMDGLQAAILDVKLKHLPRWTERRQALAASYREVLTEVSDLLLPEERPEATHVYHLYVVRTSRRDELLQHLAREGIGAGIHYPVPVHRQPAFATLGHEAGAYPVAERLAVEILSLPLYPEFTERQMERVVQAVRTGHAAAR